VARTRGFSRFVGRSDDMAALEVALARALGGNGQVIGVVAEPGVGKSRLCYEFAQRCRARGLAVDEAHGVAHGKAIPFLPVIEYLRAYFGITERDADQAAREKIAGKLLLLDPQFADSLPLLFDFLGVSDPERPAPRTDPEVRQRLLFAAMKRLVHARSRREPGVTVLEDLHWIDGGSEAFLENFVEAAAGTRTLIVANFRPEYHAGWMQKSYYQQLPLAPLGAEASAELLHDLLGADPSLAGMADRIRQRTAGNPFFIEEIVQGLVEAGHLHGIKGAYRLGTPAGDEALPGTVQSVLAARIDRLGDREKSVLQTAAVIGKQFTEPVLQHVAELPAAEVAAALDALVRSEFLYEEALYPEAAYAFKHPLTQEVAYRSQLGARRAKVHAAVARTIATLYPEQLDQRARARLSLGGCSRRPRSGALAQAGSGVDRGERCARGAAPLAAGARAPRDAPGGRGDLRARPARPDGHPQPGVAPRDRRGGGPCAAGRGAGPGGADAGAAPTRAAHRRLRRDPTLGRRPRRSARA
jgi:predicted ATPase